MSSPSKLRWGSTWAKSDFQPSVLMGCFTYGRRMSEMNERVWIAMDLFPQLILGESAKAQQSWQRRFQKTCWQDDDHRLARYCRHGPQVWLSARLKGYPTHVGMMVSTKRMGQTRRSSPMGKCLQGSRHIYYGPMPESDHLVSLIMACWQNDDGGQARWKRGQPKSWPSTRLRDFYNQWEHYTYLSKMSLQIGLETAASGAATNSSRQLVSNSCAVVCIFMISSDTSVFFSGFPKAITKQSSYVLLWTSSLGRLVLLSWLAMFLMVPKSDEFIADWQMLSRVFIRIGLISATAMFGSSRTSIMIDDLMLMVVYLSFYGG